jgi:hypothetical protein
MSDEDGGYPALGRGTSLAILIAVVAFFLVGMGPVWLHRWDVDRSILYSYVPIPFLVAGALAWRRRLSVKAWVLHTFEITFAKFVITATVLVSLWASSDGPPLNPVERRPAEYAASGAADASVAEVPVEPTPLGPTGAVAGQVQDSGGAPLEGVLVFISAGLEKFVFPAPSGNVVLHHDGERLTPAVAGVRVGQPMEVRSSSKTLHTLVARRGTTALVNVPVLAHQGARPVVFRDPKGLVTLSCSVHGSSEAGALLGVFAHPYFAVSGADGRFQLEAIPAGLVEISAGAASGTGRADVKVEAGGAVAVRLVIGRTG